jgi:hypothetical protein
MDTNNNTTVAGILTNWIRKVFADTFCDTDIDFNNINVAMAGSHGFGDYQ